MCKFGENMVGKVSKCGENRLEKCLNCVKKQGNEVIERGNDIIKLEKCDECNGKTLEKCEEHYYYKYFDEETDQEDVINHPSHYCSGGIETIDFIKAKLTKEEFIGYCKGNVIKYLSRAGKKGDEAEDIKKAEVYLSWARETVTA